MAETTQRMSLTTAVGLAQNIVSRICGGCERIEVAGSIRRKKPDIGDIEIVCIPKRVGLMEDSALDPILQSLVEQDKLRRIKNGEKMKQFDVVNAGCKLDLFIVEPETWGVQFLIRTGPADFSKRFVTQRSIGGYMPDSMCCRDGRLWHVRKWAGDDPVMDSAVAIPTPEETDAFAAVGLDFIEPEKRQ